jgi:hypothetical protein
VGDDGSVALHVDVFLVAVAVVVERVVVHVGVQRGVQVDGGAGRTSHVRCYKKNNFLSWPGVNVINNIFRAFDREWRFFLKLYNVMVDFWHQTAEFRVKMPFFLHVFGENIQMP